MVSRIFIFEYICFCICEWRSPRSWIQWNIGILSVVLKIIFHKFYYSKSNLISRRRLIFRNLLFLCFLLFRSEFLGFKWKNFELGNVDHFQTDFTFKRTDKFYKFCVWLLSNIFVIDLQYMLLIYYTNYRLWLKMSTAALILMQFAYSRLDRNLHRFLFDFMHV